MSVAFDPRGRLALSGGWDGTVRVWDLDSGEQTVQFDGHSGQVWCVACSADGRWGLSGGTDRIVRLWNLSDGAEVRRFEGHTDQVGGVEFCLPNNRIISVGDRTARVWDMNTGRQLSCSPQLPSMAQCGTFLDVDGIPFVLIGTERDGLHLWRVPPEAGLSVLRPKGITRTREELCIAQEIRSMF